MSRAICCTSGSLTPNGHAWPFGVSDPLVQQIARDTGYEAAFSLGNRHTLRSDDRFALPRYLVTEAMGAAQLRHLLMASFG